MRVLLLSDPNCPHTVRWGLSLAERGICVRIFGLGDLKTDAYNGKKGISVSVFNQSVVRDKSTLLKLKYLSAVFAVRSIIRQFRPDIVHAHFASSYGVVGALCGFQPYLLSVWGTDVFAFPRKSIFHRLLLKYNLKKACRIFSTSAVMAKETRLYTGKDIHVIPFGIDVEQFRPFDGEGLFDKHDIVVGTVKTLEEVYGIEYLIRAFKIVYDRYPQLPLKLMIVGGGSLKSRLESLSKELGLDKVAVFTGAVPHNEVVRYHNMLTISVSVSNSESFGVAILEACACGKPVVVSNVGGLPEVVEDGITGLVVPPRDPVSAAAAIEKLILDPSLRKRMGDAGRMRVCRCYDWRDNVDQMVAHYNQVLEIYKRKGV